MLKSSKLFAAAAMLLSFGSTPSLARSFLQCAPYARSVSGIALHGNAHTWWQQAAGSYQRGSVPQVNSVLVFQSSRAMPVGHVAVVSEVVDARHIILNHANWSRPGMIEKHALAEDVSDAGDWSNVRVWYDPGHSLGLRANAAFGFIYASPSQATPSLIASTETRIALADNAG